MGRRRKLLGSKCEWQSLGIIDLIGDNVKRVEINANALLNACKDVDLAVNIGETKYMK